MLDSHLFRTEEVAELTTCSAVFEVTDCDGRQVTSPRKLASIKQVSSLETGCVMKPASLNHAIDD